MRLGLGLGIGHARRVGGGGGGSSLPQLVTDGLVAFLDPDVGITDTGDGTPVTQVVGGATFVPGSATGPTRDDLGWGRMFHNGGWPGFSRALDFQSQWLVTSDPQALSLFGPTTSDFTIVAATWAQSSNSNLFVCGVGNTSTNVSISCLLSGTGTISMASQSAGGSGTISVADANKFTRTRYITLVAWRQEGTRHRIYCNDFVIPLLDSTFTWTSNPSTRFAIGARPDLSVDVSARAAFKFFGGWNRALTDEEFTETGRYLAMRSNAPLCGWGSDEITPRVWS